MKLTRFLYFLPLYFLCFACGSSTPAPKDTVEVKKSENEDDLLFSIASELIVDPKTQAEKDKNTIINYILDEGIELKPTDSGLYYQVIEEGAGENAKWGDWVTVNYEGYTLDGKVFDSSYKRGKSIEFYVGNMIAGWNEGLQLMKPGGKAFFVVPSGLAYGEKGYPNLIPPHTTLAFEVELVSITQK